MFYELYFSVVESGPGKGKTEDVDVFRETLSSSLYE